MVQQVIEWVVTVPQGKTLTVAEAEACKGNTRLAQMLNYFLYEASREAKRQNVTLTDENVTLIEIKRSLDDIVSSLAHYNKPASKKTIYNRIVNLQSLGYVQSDSYHQIYRVKFRDIQKALNNPPLPEPTKPRGRAAHKDRPENSSEECKFESKGKSTFFSHSTDEIAKKLACLQEEIVNLQSEMVNLQSENVNLQSSLSHEKACRADLEAKVSTLHSIVHSNLTQNTITVSTSANASANLQEEKQPVPLFDTSKTSKPQKDVYLTDTQRAWFENVYCKCKKMVATRPIVKESLRDAIAILSETPQTQTLEGLNKLYDYARSQPFMQGKAIKPGNLTYYLNDWLQMEQLQAPANPKAEPSRPSALVSKPQEIKNKLRMFRFSLEKRIAENKPEEADKLRVTIARLEAQLAEIEPALAIAV